MMRPLAQARIRGLAPQMPSQTDRIQVESLETVRREPLIARFREIRGLTRRLAEPLAPEDQVVQSMPDVSPTKWHLAHTSWFFESFILRTYQPGYRSFHPQFAVLFNSYYETVGPQHARPRRGLLSRPTVEEVHAYRRYVDERMVELIGESSEEVLAQIAPLVELGLQHEQQHQELLLMDIKHVFSCNPMRPAYLGDGEAAGGEATAMDWVDRPGGTREIGADPESESFHYDNETPRHRVLLRDHALGSRPVTCGDYLEFMADGGYRRPELWLADGWDHVRRNGWLAPEYWFQEDRAWKVFTLAGAEPVREAEPVVHVSYFEADAYARWRGARLPTEAEWEVAAAKMPRTGDFVESVLEAGRVHPRSPASGEGLQEVFGTVWEWTSSAYSAYPGYRPWPGPIGEYNGKFMCNQFVLRGGACVTSEGHVRPTYRNFFYPHQRWQFSGIRLAKDA